MLSLTQKWLYNQLRIPVVNNQFNMQMVIELLPKYKQILKNGINQYSI